MIFWRRNSFGKLTKMAVGFSLVGLIFSAGQSTAADLESALETPEIPPGILPVPEYGGDIANRAYLSGDWGGERTQWAEKGFQFDVDSLVWIDTVLDGGSSNKAELGGNVTYNVKLDLMRAGIIPGAVLQARVESRGGSSANLNTGQAVPVNTAALSPTNYSDIDAGYGLALTQLSYFQLLSEQFAVTFGKLDLYGDGDVNEFAGGRGRTQFMNWSLNYGTSLLLTPATTVGAGVVFLPSKELNVTSLLISGTECTVDNCFKNLDDKGGVSITSVTYQYNLGGLPGGVSGSFMYFFDKDFTDLNSIVPTAEGGLVGTTRTKSWIAGGSFWQYLYAEDYHGGPLNLTNKQPDLQGWGIFSRLTFADERTNPWKMSIAAGAGGRGVIPGRPNDVFGIGYFYNKLAEARFIAPIDDGQGFEGFYNLAITPAAKLSANVQYTKSIVPSVDKNSLLLSTRFQTVF